MLAQATAAAVRLVEGLPWKEVVIVADLDVTLSVKPSCLPQVEQLLALSPWFAFALQAWVRVQARWRERTAASAELTAAAAAVPDSEEGNDSILST